MPSTLAERKLHTIELIAKLDNEATLAFVEQLLSAEAGEKWLQLLAEAMRLDASVLPNTLTDDEIMEEVNVVRRKRYEAR
jgi:hypothetical protein